MITEQTISMINNMTTENVDNFPLLELLIKNGAPNLIQTVYECAAKNKRYLIIEKLSKIGLQDNALTYLVNRQEDKFNELKQIDLITSTRCFEYIMASNLLITKTKVQKIISISPQISIYDFNLIKSLFNDEEREKIIIDKVQCEFTKKMIKAFNEQLKIVEEEEKKFIDSI